MQPRIVNFVLDSLGLPLVQPVYEDSLKLVEGDNQNGFTSRFGTLVVGALALRYKQEQQIQLSIAISQVNMTKTIVKTAIQGLDGTVKEYINDGDYEITIRGAIVSNDRSYPSEQVKQLHQILLIKDALDVESEYLNVFGIYNVVVESYSFPQQEGMQNLQLFELQCVSDLPIELVVDNETLN